MNDDRQPEQRMKPFPSPWDPQYGKSIGLMIRMLQVLRQEPQRAAYAFGPTSPAKIRRMFEKAAESADLLDFYSFTDTVIRGKNGSEITLKQIGGCLSKYQEIGPDRAYSLYHEPAPLQIRLVNGSVIEFDGTGSKKEPMRGALDGGIVWDESDGRFKPLDGRHERN